MMGNVYENGGSSAAYGAVRAHGAADGRAHKSLSEGVRRANEQEMRRVLTQAFCGVDTCALLCLNSGEIERSERRQRYFLGALEHLCEEEQVNLFTSVRVYEELVKLEGLGDQNMKRFARRAIDFVRRMNAKGQLMVCERRSRTETNADQELFLLCSEEYLKNPVCIFTLDRNLAEALLRQNENKMVRHHRIMVRRVNMRGCLSEFDFDRAEKESAVQTADEPSILPLQEVKPMREERKACDVPVIKSDFCMSIERMQEKLPRSLRYADELPRADVKGLRARVEDMILNGCEFACLCS